MAVWVGSTPRFALWSGVLPNEPGNQVTRCEAISHLNALFIILKILAQDSRYAATFGPVMICVVILSQQQSRGCGISRNAGSSASQKLREIPPACVARTRFLTSWKIGRFHVPASISRKVCVLSPRPNNGRVADPRTDRAFRKIRSLRPDASSVPPAG